MDNEHQALLTPDRPAPVLAIGIVAYRRGAMTRRCIDSIRATARIPYHIYLADNGSEDDATRSFLESCEHSPDISLLRLSQNYGPAAGRNRILERALDAHEIVAMLDNDIVVLPGWDEAAVASIRRGFDLVQPKLLRADGKTVERGPTEFRQNPLPASPRYLGLGAPRHAPEVSRRAPAAIVGGTGIVAAAVYRALGGYDERLHVGEDFELSFRARGAGFRLGYEPDCEMIHDHGFDHEYDEMRQDLEGILRSHVILWGLHRKAILCPRYLRWFGWLYRHGEPMYLKRTRSLRMLLRRLRRRLMMTYFMWFFPSAWTDVADVEQCTREYADRLAPDLSLPGADVRPAGAPVGDNGQREGILIEKHGRRYRVRAGYTDRFWRSLAAGEWEEITFDVFDRYLDRTHSYIDIGAWIGPTLLYGCQLARKAYGIEPDPVAFAELEANVALNLSSTKNVVLVKGCIAAKCGAVCLGNKQRGGDSTSSMLFGSEETHWTVDGMTLDALAAAHGIDDCSFIKMDIEGGEYLVLPAMKDYLRRRRPTIYVSFHPACLGPVDRKSIAGRLSRVFHRFVKMIRTLTALNFYKHFYTPEGAEAGFIGLLWAGLRSAHLGVIFTDIQREKARAADRPPQASEP